MIPQPLECVRVFMHRGGQGPIPSKPEPGGRDQSQASLGLGGPRPMSKIRTWTGPMGLDNFFPPDIFLYFGGKTKFCRGFLVFFRGRLVSF